MRVGEKIPLLFTCSLLFLKDKIAESGQNSTILEAKSKTHLFFSPVIWAKQVVRKPNAKVLRAKNGAFRACPELVEGITTRF